MKRPKYSHRLPTVLALAVLVCSLAHAQTAKLRPTEPVSSSISIPAESELRPTLSSLKAATDSAILSEVPLIARRMSVEVRGSGLESALKAVSADMQLYWVRRHGSLVFQRRFADPRERLTLEAEEITALISDLYKLAHAKVPFGLTVQNIVNQNSFANSLSEQQKQVMRKGKLPIDQLTGEQRDLWSKINLAHGYANVHETLENSNAAFGNWPRTRLALKVSQRLGELLWYEWPNASDPDGFTGINLQFRALPAGAVRYNDGPGIVRPARPALPASFDRPVRLGDGETTAGKVVRALEAATGNEIKIPKHCEGRKLLAYAIGAPARAVVTGLEDLYGWTLRFQSGRRYSLRRPRYVDAKDAEDLHSAMRAMLPQQVHRLWSLEGQENANARLGIEFTEAMAAANQEKGRNWKALPMGELSDATQQRWANALFDTMLRPSCGLFASQAKAPTWLAKPELGFFTLSGDGKHPLLEFRVPRGDGTVDAWGWGVGTSSFEAGK